MKKQQIKAGFTAALAGILAPVALVVPSVSAATISWNGTTDSNFSTSANWDGGVIPSNLDSAVFSSTAFFADGSQTLSMPENDMGGFELVKLIFNGAVSKSSSSYVITGNGITITSGIDAIMTGSGGDHQVKTDVILGADATFTTSGSNSLQVGDDGTTLDLGSNDLTLAANGGTITIAGEIDGSGKVIVDGDKKVSMLAKAATGYTGSTEVTSGEYVVTEETEGNIVINGGTLKGNSELLGTVTMSGGAIAPGNSPGCLGTSNLTLTGGTYQVELNGTDACTGYDQVAVIGTVNLGTATTLDISRLSSFAPEDNTAFAVILNDGTDAVTGTFSGLADGATFTEDGYTYQINYDAGDGNDVLVQVIGTPTAPDTGAETLLTNPVFALASVISALAVVGGLKFAEQRRK